MSGNVRVIYTAEISFLYAKYNFQFCLVIFGMKCDLELSFVTLILQYYLCFIQKAVLEDLHTENSKLAGLLCKLRAFSHWRLVIGQEKLQKELLQWQLVLITC